MLRRSSCMLGVPALAACLKAKTAAAAAPEPWQLGFQPPGSPIMDQVRELHLVLLVIMVAVAAGVLALLLFLAWRYNERRHPRPSERNHSVLLEIAWTAIPVAILVAMSVPSLRLLYRQADASDPAMTIKVTGHQWYWSYQYPDSGGVSFDSFMVRGDDLKPDDKRLLEAKPHMVVPVDTVVRVKVTSADVIHSWAVPSLGVKTDAIPGQANETWIEVNEPGLYFGQCSELCGAGHPYMPIVVEAVSQGRFQDWISRHGA